MPIYVYRCESCGSHIEKRQSFSDAPLSECEACGGRLRKVIQPAPVIFKGSGWYATDSRSPSGANGGNGKSHDGEGSKTTSDPASSTKSAEAAPASKTETKASSESSLATSGTKD